MTFWVWAAEPFDTWFGPYPDETGEAPEEALERLQEMFGLHPLQLIKDSKLVRRRVECASMSLDEEE